MPRRPGVKQFAVWPGAEVRIAGSRVVWTVERTWRQKSMIALLRWNESKGDFERRIVEARRLRPALTVMLLEYREELRL